ncbi:hypothetical protein TCAL_01969, partial [Tigriopus californicus]
MPKHSKYLFCPNDIILEFGGAKKKTFFSKLCSVVFEQGRKSPLRAHVETVKHKKNLQLNEEGRNPRQQMLNMSTAENKHSNFAQALCKAFVTANIPLTKVEHPSVVELIQEHVTAPSRWTMTRIMEQECQNLLAEIKTRLTGKSIFVAVDETTDRTGRAMCAILAGPLDGKFLQWPFLIDLADIVRANNQTVQQFVMSALFKLLGDALEYQEIRLFLTDGAAYCLKAGRDLK